MSSYSLDQYGSFFRENRSIRYLDVNHKTNRSLSSRIYNAFNPQNITSPNYNIICSIPLITDNYRTYTQISNMIVYLKRELTAPEAIILYSDLKSIEKTNEEIETIALEYMKSKFFLDLPSNKIKSINLNSILHLVLDKENMYIKDTNIIYRYNYNGFSFRFTLKDKITENDNIIEKVNLKMLNIVDVKKSILKFIDQLHHIVNYNQINREYILKLLNNLTDRNTNFVITHNITDIINCNKFATLDDDFINFWKTIDWESKQFREFTDIIDDTVVDTFTPESKSINIRGIQFIIKNKIKYTLPALLDNVISTKNDKRKLCYALLTYFDDSYDDFKNAISLVKLRALSNS